MRKKVGQASWPVFLFAAAPLLAQNPASVWITAPDSRIIAGASAQLTAIPRDATGRALNTVCSFSLTGNNNPFTVDSTGVVTARSLGIGDITAVCGNARNTVRLQSVPSAITVTPQEREIAIGESVSYSAQVLDVKGVPIPDVPLSWNVIGEDANSTASVFITNAGQLSSVGAGRFTVRATYAYTQPPAGQPNSGQGQQFIPQFYGRSKITVRPPRSHRLTRLVSTGDRREFFQLRPRGGQIAVNSSGQIAFNASLEGYGTGLFLHDGRPRMLAAAGGPGDVPLSIIWDFDEPSINNRGDVFGSVSHWGIGNGLVWVANGEAPRFVLQDGSTYLDIRNIFADRRALNDNGQAIFRGTLLNPGARVRTTGLFSISMDGAIDLLVESTQQLEGVDAGWTFSSFTVDNALNVAFSALHNGLQTVYLVAPGGIPRRIAGPGDRINNREVRLADNPLLSLQGDLSVTLRFTTGGASLLLCPKGDCTQARSIDAGDIRETFAIGERGETVFYGNAGSGVGIYVWDTRSTPRLVFQEDKLSPSGAIYSSFQSAGITSSGDVIAQARTNTNLFVVMRASGAQRTTVVQAGDFVSAAAGPVFTGIALGGKAGPAHLLTGGYRNNVFEVSLNGIVPRIVSGDRLPSGGWYEGNYNVRKLPNGELIVATNDSLHLVAPDSVRLVKTFPTIVDGVSTNTATQFAGNSSGAIVTGNGTNVAVSRMLLYQDGDYRHIAWIGSGNAAYRTASPSGGNFDGINDLWLTDDGLIYANMRVNGGPAGLFLYDGQWRAIALINDEIDGRRLTGISEIKVGGTHIFARLQLTNRVGIYEFTGAGWRKVIAQSDDSPTGSLIGSVGTFDANRSGQVAARVDTQARYQLVLVDGEKVSVVHDFNLPSDSGEWLRDPISIDLRDDGRIFFTIRNYADQVTLYEADPL